MDKILVRIPLALKAKVTETLKAKIIADLEKQIKNMELDLEQFEFQANKALRQAASDLSVLPALRGQIEEERNKRVAAKTAAEEQLKRARNLALGSEVGHGTLERTVEIEVGTDLEALMQQEILLEDGKVIAVRG